MYWQQQAPWDRYYYGPQSFGKGKHRRPNNSQTNTNRSGHPCRFCPACGLVHSDNRLTTCRDPACGTQLTPPTTSPPSGSKGGGKGTQQGQGTPAKNGPRQPPPPQAGKILPLPPNQRPVGGGLNQGELNTLVAVEVQQLRRQELDEQGCWPPVPAKEGVPTALSADDALAVAMFKSSITALQSVPVETQDVDLIAALETKLAKVVGKQASPMGEQRAAGKLTHILGKLRTTYATDKEACQREAKAAQAALEAAQLRVSKAEEWDQAIDAEFHKRQARVQTALDNCAPGDTPPPTRAVPTVHLPDATIQYALPPDVLASALSGAIQTITGEHQLGADSPELKAMQLLSSLLLSKEIQNNLGAPPPAQVDYAAGDASVMDLLGDIRMGSPHTSMEGSLADAWQSPVPSGASDGEDVVCAAASW